jgi:hypothetical protein
VSDDDLSAWRANRRDAAEEHAAALDRRKAGESDEARQLIAAFVTSAQERGLSPSPLVARARNGRGTYRTGLTGWYLKHNRSIAVDTAGNFYVLTAPASVKARFTGVEVTPSDPPLIVGVGGRDGESMPMSELLQLRLESGEDW